MDLFNILTNPMCDQTTGLLPVFGFIGNIVTFIKIAVPILLIVMGSIDLTKAVMASKDDDIKKAQSTLMKRAIVGVVIFFIPTIVTMLMSLVAGPKSDIECIQCITSPGKDFCKIKDTTQYD